MPYSHDHDHYSSGKLVPSLLPVHIVHTADTLSTAMAHTIMEQINRMVLEHSQTHTNALNNSTDNSIVVHQCIRDHDFFQHITHIASNINNPVASGSIIAIDMHGIQSFHAAVAVHGIVSAQCYDEFTSRMTRAHNNAKCITLASSILSPTLGSRIAELFLTTPFEGGRHEDRLKLLHKIGDVGGIGDVRGIGGISGIGDGGDVGGVGGVGGVDDVGGISGVGDGGSTPDKSTATTTLVAIGCDHSALQHKNEIKAYIEAMGAPSSSNHVYKVVDVGTNTTESVHYPNYGEAVGRLVASGEAHLGVVICGTGVGIVNAASKVGGIRSTLALHPSTAHIAQSMYSCNVLAIGARTTGVGVALELVELFVTPRNSSPLAG